MGNWYRVTKRINGRLYNYWQRTKRVGKSVKTENRYIGPAFGRNDRVCITNIATGRTAERTVKDAKQGYLIVFDDVSGIPYKASHDQWRFEMIAKGDPMAPLPKFGITFKELAEQEAAAEISDPFAHARFGQPQFIPKTGYLPEAQQYVNEWGTHSYGEKRSAELYAADLEKGEGGMWRVEQQRDGSWRAHRITTTPGNTDPQLTTVAVASSVSPTAPYVPEEALPQLTPFTAQLEGKDKRDYEKRLAKIRAEDELIQYGNLKNRIKKQDAKVRAIKRKIKGIKTLNPFIGQAMLKEKQ